MLTCHSCGETNIPDGTAVCPICNQPLGLTVAPAISPLASSAPVAPATGGPSALSGSASVGVGVLIPLDAAGIEDVARAYAFPSSPSFRLLLGRTDMSATPPVVAQINVATLWPDLNTRPAGNLFSRASAVFRRDPITGMVYLMHHPDSSMRLVFKRVAETEYQMLLPGDEIALETDTELVFGKSSESQAFVVR